MKFELQNTVDSPTTLVDFIAEQCSASKAQIKKALNLGGGWLKKKGQKSQKRCRRAKTNLSPGDRVSFYFDSQLLNLQIPAAEPLLQNNHWGLWYKPAGVPSQGTLFGDAGCMLEQVKDGRKGQPSFLIHRLDTETAGIMLFAYNKQAAAQLSEVWQKHQVQKVYQAEVLGQPEPIESKIELPLDGKPTLTHYKTMNSSGKTSGLEVTIETGRYHQIRRHFEAIGHPVMGDPRYGKGNKNTEGLKLVATQLSFNCPFSKQFIMAELDAHQRLF